MVKAIGCERHHRNPEALCRRQIGRPLFFFCLFTCLLQTNNANDECRCKPG